MVYLHKMKDTTWCIGREHEMEHFRDGKDYPTLEGFRDCVNSLHKSIQKIIFIKNVKCQHGSQVNIAHWTHLPFLWASSEVIVFFLNSPSPTLGNSLKENYNVGKFVLLLCTCKSNGKLQESRLFPYYSGHCQELSHKSFHMTVTCCELQGILDDHRIKNIWQ